MSPPVDGGRPSESQLVSAAECEVSNYEVTVSRLRSTTCAEAVLDRTCRARRFDH
jgi:hypothetical protein